MSGINPVGTWIDSNFETQTGTAYKTALDNSIRAGKRIANAFAAHQNTPPSMSVVIEPGMLWVSSNLLETGQQVISGITAPVANSRIDRIVIDKTTGAVSHVQGAEAVSPTVAAIPSNKLPCVHFQLFPGQTVIVNGGLNDERLGGGLGSEVKMFDAPSNLVSRTTDAGFTDVDISGPTGGDVAKVAILQVRLAITVQGEACPLTEGRGWALARFRRNGSGTTANLPRIEARADTGVLDGVTVSTVQTSMIMVELDGAELFEYDLVTTLDSGASAVINEFRIDLAGYIL